ncbi:MAG: cbb3-type cytochrome oxidase subunit 3 [Acetobacteraceae bacterium]
MTIMPLIQWIQHHSVVLMLIAFLLIVVTTFWPGRKPRFDRDSRIPLEDDR